jgi:hypothetical protein
MSAPLPPWLIDLADTLALSDMPADAATMPDALSDNPGAFRGC